MCMEMDTVLSAEALILEKALCARRHSIRGRWEVNCRWEATEKLRGLEGGLGRPLGIFTEGAT